MFCRWVLYLLSAQNGLAHHAKNTVSRACATFPGFTSALASACVCVRKVQRDFINAMQIEVPAPAAHPKNELACYIHYSGS